MADMLVLIVCVILMVLALKGAIKHFKGESSCCGRGYEKISKTEDKKLSGPVMGKKTINISGMHCERCVESLTNEINKIDGVSAKVSLKKSQAVISYDREIDDKDIQNAVESAGFKII
ncbi:heavy metal-associated domain-containing protein [Anaerofustis sp.]|uniref:heavy-metal-associated domain-containing protein n=1 Tax=Anaerofustis sp. TaxID=1872517 RepID=UPI0025BE8667|nr:heavy metal-associated domain-containing protein [Anaerofustis sp.]